jgi:hypothetical protein
MALKPILAGIEVKAFFQWLNEETDELEEPATLSLRTYRTLTAFAAGAAPELREDWETLRQNGRPADNLPG